MLFRRRTIEQEFEAEVMPHLDELFRTSVRLTGGNQDDAQDLVQELFTQAWKSFHRYERGTNCRAWLYSILMNKARHYHRRQQNRKVIPLSEGQEETLLANLAGDAAVSDHLVDEDVLSALDRISVEHREVVLLADVQEFSYKETAEIIGIPIGTVMSRLSRGRALLRKELIDCAKEYGINTTKEGGK